MAYPDGVSFRGTPYANEPLYRSERDAEADAIEAAIKSIEAIKKIAQARLIDDLSKISKRSDAVASLLAREANTSTPALTLAEYALDDYEDWVLAPLKAALDEVQS